MQWISKYTLASISILTTCSLVMLYESSCASPVRFKHAGASSENAASQHSAGEELVGIVRGDTFESDPKRAQRLAHAIQANRQALLNSESPYSGAANGNTTLVVFFDYQCNHCKMIAPVLEGLQNHNPSLKIVYKELPILGETSNYAAKAALAAQDQHHYAAFSEQLMKADSLSPHEILKIAQHLGLNVDELKAKIDSNETERKIEQNISLAKNLTIKGTPAMILLNKEPQMSAESGPQAFFVSGKVSFETLQELVNKLDSM